MKPFDRVSEIKPVDTFGLLVSAGLVEGILEDFIGIAMSQLPLDECATLVACKEKFLTQCKMDTLERDPRFWHTMKSGVYEALTKSPELASFETAYTPPPVEAIKRSRLAQIEGTLSPYREGKDRPVTFEPDGTIVYTDDSFDEALGLPLDINGYQRDPENPHRFIPLWPSCISRHQIGIRYPKCGCINVIMRCSNSACPKFQDRVTHLDCSECPHRVEE